MSKAAMDQDPEWRFDARPPGWMIGLVILWAIGINLASAGIVDLVEWVWFGSSPTWGR